MNIILAITATLLITVGLILVLEPILQSKPKTKKPKATVEPVTEEAKKNAIKTWKEFSRSHAPKNYIETKKELDYVLNNPRFLAIPDFVKKEFKYNLIGVLNGEKIIISKKLADKLGEK